MGEQEPLLSALCCMISGWAVLGAVTADGGAGGVGSSWLCMGLGTCSHCSSGVFDLEGRNPEDPHLSIWALAACAR